MKFYPNGILLQPIDSPSTYLHNLKFQYQGLDAYGTMPLCGYSSDVEARCLHEEYYDWLFDAEIGQKTEVFYSLPFLRRYLRKCKELHIQTRLVFVESEFCKPLWEGPVPNLRFMGYEFCSTPFDCQIITDLAFHKPFAEKYVPLLNQYGLFGKLEDCEAFKLDYEQAFAAGEVGDGDATNMIYRLSLVESGQDEWLASWLHHRTDAT